MTLPLPLAAAALLSGAQPGVAAPLPETAIVLVLPAQDAAALAQTEQSTDQAARAPSGPDISQHEDQADDSIVVTAGSHPPGDPLNKLNEQSFEVVQALDTAIVEPVSIAYRDALPEPVRDGLHNLLSNLTEPVVALNFLLQLKPGKAVETVGRFVVNSTLGVAGLFDVAKKEPFNLPYRKNGLANTLGYYGVGPGPFLYLPFIGPTTVRDLGGRLVDLSILPAAVGKPLSEPIVGLARGSLSSLDERIREAPKIQALKDSPDPYTATKEWYLQGRQMEIDALKGKPVSPRPAVPGPDPRPEIAPAPALEPVPAN